MANPLLRSGPIPAFVHGAVEYAAGVAFIAAPLLLGFEQRPATVTSIIVGIVILVVAASTSSPTGLMDGITIPVHVVLDFVLAVFLIVAPFLFQFTDDTPATAFFILLGVAHLLITLGTRFVKERPATAKPGKP